MNSANNIELDVISEPTEVYGMNDLVYKDEVYKIIACCFEVHNNLGKGLLEAVYKDALMVEFKLKSISFERERKFEIDYKGVILPHYYLADFLVENKIIIEVKAQSGLAEDHYKQILNYLALSKRKLGLLVNFGEDKLKFKRIVL